MFVLTESYHLFLKSEDFIQHWIIWIDSRPNTFLFGHDDPFQGVTMGVEPPKGIYPDPMGVAYVAKPLGNGNFQLVAKLLPTQWGALAQF